jgi:hypothetical protein
MYNLTLGQKNQLKKNHMFFMPHAFSQNENPFGQRGHFSQVELLKNHDFL